MHVGRTGVARTIGAFSAGSFGQGAFAFIRGTLTVGAGLVLTARPVGHRAVVGADMVFSGFSRPSLKGSSPRRNTGVACTCRDLRRGTVHSTQRGFLMQRNE